MRRKWISSASAAITLTAATSWLARRFSAADSISESVRSPSIQKRPQPYHTAYSKKISPWKQRFFIKRNIMNSPAKHHRLSYKNVGCTGIVGSTVMPCAASEAALAAR